MKCCVKAWGGAVVIGDGAGAGGPQRLRAVEIGHCAASRGEPCFDLGEGEGVFDERVVHRFGEGVAREVVGGWTKAARADDDFDAMGEAEEGVGVGLGVVWDGDVLDGNDAGVHEALGEPLGICVKGLAQRQFVTDGDDGGELVGWGGQVALSMGRRESFGGGW